MVPRTCWKIGLLLALSLLIGLAAVIVRNGNGHSAMLKGTGTAPKSAVRRRNWQLVGPCGWGALFAPAVSPYNQNFVAACHMSGFCLSKDGGCSWRMINVWSHIRQFVVDPAKATVL
jgi:hypothetical protein